MPPKDGKQQNIVSRALKKILGKDCEVEKIIYKYNNNNKSLFQKKVMHKFFKLQFQIEKLTKFCGNCLTKTHVSNLIHL